jgi:diguanylate cyclase
MNGNHILRCVIELQNDDVRILSRVSVHVSDDCLGITTPDQPGLLMVRGEIMVPESSDNDLLIFKEEIGPAVADRTRIWRILIVDDEPSVHQATVLALKGVSIEQRLLEFVHAFSAAEARSCLLEYSDLAVVLLDVVMESDDAGLTLIQFIRQDLGNHELRIVLRTGQPGYAPEIDTIRAYDINDYKTKSELTRIRLFSSMMVAIRSYWQIHQLEANRRGLERILLASADLSQARELTRFAEGVVTQLCALLGVPEEGVVCAAAIDGSATPYVLAASGCYSDWRGERLAAIPDPRIRQVLETTLVERRHYLGESTCLSFSVPDDISLAAFVDVSHSLNDLDYNLLGVFCGNISVAFENTQLLQRISDLAFEDPFLKLPNRNSFLAQIDQRPTTSDMLALVDIDGFADINSILDQNFGDAVLQVVADRLCQVFLPAAQVARVGSDVFGLLGPNMLVNERQIEAIFARPFEVGEENLRLSATTGLVCLDETACRGVELLRNAGVALKQAKVFSRGKALYYEAALATAARERMQMLSRLRLAFSVEHLFLVYQPFVNLATGRIVGAEALLRWRMDGGEFVPPDSFIPLAEQSGLMVPIGDWVVQNALRFLKRLADLGQREFRMAINVSHVEFREPDYVDKLVKAIRDHRVSPGNIEIELTESVAIDNIELTERKLSAVRAAGVAISIDDFGTGYSSLNVLRQMNVDRLKIDRAFVSGIVDLDADYGIVETVLRLADQLGLKTIAEGIETRAQREKMTSMGCHDGQGYLFSEPLTSEQFELFILEQGSK